jgi:hypothetical protein
MATKGGHDIACCIFDRRVEEFSIVDAGCSGVELVKAISKKRLQLGPIIIANTYLDTRHVVAPHARTQRGL